MTRKFSSISVQTTLATGISNTALTVPVAVGTGSTLMGGVSLAGGNVDQYSIIMDPDTASAEIMWVTGVSGDDLTVLRGKDGTSAIAHNSGAVIKHVLTGGDLIYLVGAAAPTADLTNTGLPFPGSTSGTNTLKAPAITGTVTNTLPATTGTLMSAESVDAATSKTIPVDADEIPLSDSAASFGIKKLTWANIKATLKTYFDTLYQATGLATLKSILTTTGDIYYASGASTPARLGIGSTGNVLTVAGGVPSWTAPAGGGLIPIGTLTTFTTSSAVNINNCFSATYKRYRVLIKIIGSANGVCSIKMRVGGTDSSAAYYWASANIPTSGAAIGNNAGSNLTTGFGIVDKGAGDPESVSIDFFDPFVAALTNIHFESNSVGTGVHDSGGGWHVANTSYDGFSIIPTAGTITGEVMVYGYTN